MPKRRQGEGGGHGVPLRCRVFKAEGLSFPSAATARSSGVDMEIEKEEIYTIDR
jgi:hypothetical protein